MQTVPVRTRFAALLGLTGLLALTALPAAQAQDSHNHMPRRNDFAPSISNMVINTPAKSKASSKQAVAPQALADAIVAQTLRDLWDQADEHWHEGEYSHIVNLYRTNAQGDPRNLDAYANGSWLLWSMDRKPEAEALLKQGVRANPANYYMYDELGRYFYICTKDYKSAIPYYEKAVKFKVPYATWNALAQCYQRTNQWEKAVKAWERAAEYPDNAIAPNRLERARAELARRRQ